MLWGDGNVVILTYEVIDKNIDKMSKDVFKKI